MKTFLASNTISSIVVLIWSRAACRVSCAAAESNEDSLSLTFVVGSNVAVHRRVLEDCPCHGSINDAKHPAGIEDESFLIHLDMESGAATLALHDEPWFRIVGNSQQVVGWNDDRPLQLESSIVDQNHTAEEYQRFGPYTNVTFIWRSLSSRKESSSFAGSIDGESVHTSFLIFQNQQMIVFEQFFPDGWTNPKLYKGRNERSRRGGNIVMPNIVTGFPIVNLTLPKDDLGFMSWGDCMLSDPHWGDWRDVNPDDYAHLFDGDSYGQPWIVHDSTGRTVVWSSLNDFFVSGFAGQESHSLLDIGLRTTLESIPRGHRHSTILLAGSGINTTVMEWGDILLKAGNVPKERTKVYDDFTLAMLGYWTDNGSYHYFGATGPNYSNMEEALLGIKEGMKEKGIPIRYVQWDDWWMETMGDIPGILSWTPKKSVFPSGFSDWLGMPLAMYAPEYASKNVWMDGYSWKVDDDTAIPIDPDFYVDLFANGTSIGMKSFEQDFLCYYGIGKTSLVNTDVASGETWLGLMDDAAQKAGIKIQLCMPDGYHILQSTLLPSVTNARGTGDNTRDYPSVLSMGQNTFLYYALGIFTSRDNAWTSSADVEQAGCGNRKFCYEPNAHLDNLVAVLAGGPYGIGDGLEFVNKTVTMYSCRSDGLLLRPQWPLATLEFSFTDLDAKGSRVWASHDEYGSLRWSYVVGVNLAKDVALTPTRLSSRSSCACGRLVAWEVVVGQPVRTILEFSETSPFMLPASKPLNLPYEVNTPPHTHYNVAPVLPNGMVFLGETAKWATMSFGRVHALEVDVSTISLVVVGAPSEVATFAYLMDPKIPGGIEEVQCSFSESCPNVDQHGNAYCINRLDCNKVSGCNCVGSMLEDALLWEDVD